MKKSAVLLAVAILFVNSLCFTVNAGAWREIGRWEGRGYKNTETFIITSNQWRISWNYTGRQVVEPEMDIAFLKWLGSP